MKNMQPTSDTVAIYARVSSDRQAEEGTIDSQLAAVHSYAQEQGYRVAEDRVFCDNGVSGASLVRPGLDALRDKAAGKEIEKVIVLCPDRLARKHAHQMVLAEEFQRLGVEIVFVNRSISDTAEDQLLFQIQGVIAEYEREKIMERSRRGKLHQAKSGKVTVFSTAAYGYVYVPKHDGDDARLEIHPNEANVVRQIYRWFIFERMSLRQLAYRLTREGIPTRHKAAAWSPGVVYGILKNPVYCGKAAYQKKHYIPRIRPNKTSRGRASTRLNASHKWRPKEEWIYVPVPAIVSEQTFATIQQRLEENAKFSRRNAKHPYLLSGLLRCKECGYSLYGKLSTPNTRSTKFHYYRCNGLDGHRWYDGKKRCNSHPIRREALDELVWMKVKQLLQQPDVVLAEYTARQNKKKHTSLSLETLMRKKEREIRQRELEKERLLDLFQSGAVSRTEIELRLKSIRLKIETVRQETTLLEKEKSIELKKLQLIQRINDFKQNLAERLETVSIEEQQQIVRLLVTEIIVDTTSHEIHIEHCIPLDETCPLRLSHPDENYRLHP